ncbi:class I adenylate cyclase [Marinobacter sp. M216]|uniref:Class I adenylate cyclase n=1 Tax=Marinobacter albus TaxID=3030833 RepID=A0ABT7HEL2_9GAMM|nr:MULTISPECIES: class I adenylate cyclase [unclassified Marinobacter]MBW7472242.1 class I adenylate cyclase [Marinobacter sp. F4218]MDK9558812.1 class I adenylate cyclase [Marinobacter sp. M216]
MTAHVAPIALDFEEGIDRKTLRRLRDRFLSVNQQRWDRACSALTYRQQIVLEVLPLVFHANHPALPGYIDADCPYGLSHYRPPSRTLNAARRLARTFSVRSEGKRRPDLDALFLMGSPGTLGHSVASDLDLWLCHRSDLPERGIQCLERKAEKLSDWAASLGVELHVFVFCAEDWRAGRQRAEVTGENCGSAQHYLLLDEFYRTSIHLAGRYPMWWLIPADCEPRYDECMRQLVDCRFIRGDEYIDFGPVSAIPEEEFLGAGVWQLYKGIDAPWKSILKLLLIECYAQTADQPLLSSVFKQAVFRGQTDADGLDPYLLLYNRLEAWLSDSPMAGRLDLVRRSLYLKAGLPLTRAESSPEQWRARLLTQLVERWQWPEQTLAELDNRHRWRAEDVTRLRRLVVAELTHSYRLLSKMAREHGTRSAISVGDINLLGRKLYAAFQRKAGKIEQINPGLAPSLVEENLAFYHQSEQGSDGNGWLLYRDLEDPADAFWQPAIRRSGNLTELMVWCYCNGLLSRSTRLNVRAGQTVASVSELREMLEALSAFLPFPIEPADREALSRGGRPVSNLLLVNVGVDPQAYLTEKGLHKLSARHDSLGFSGGRENLVVTIDQITFNSWHEVSLQHYAAGDTLVQCLKNVLASVAGDPSELPGIRVHGHNRGHGAAIARRVQELFSDVLRQFFAGGLGPHPLRYVIEMGRRYFLLQFNGREPGFVALDSFAALMEHLALPQGKYLPVVFDRHAIPEDPALRAVSQACEPDNIQVFYYIRGDRARIWVADELGSLSSWEQAVGNRRYMLAPLLRFLENLVERRTLRHSDVPSMLAGVQCQEVVNRDGYWRTEPRPDSNSAGALPGLEVQAVGIQEGGSGVRFDIFCGEQEFTAQEYGDRLIPAVAHYIRSQRESHEAYPAYLTDVHLPHDLDPQVYQLDIQTSQYLHYRSMLESALNQALQSES